MAKPSTVPETKTEATETAVDTTTATTAAPEAAAAPAAPAVGLAGVGAVKEGNVVKLASGERRVDYIKRRFFAEKATRGAIAKELGVPYQIVFAATKTKAEASPAAGVAAAAAAIASPAAAPAADSAAPAA